MALEMEQRPEVLSPLHQAVKELELALANDLTAADKSKGGLADVAGAPHRRE